VIHRLYNRIAARLQTIAQRESRVIEILRGDAYLLISKLEGLDEVGCRPTPRRSQPSSRSAPSSSPRSSPVDMDAAIRPRSFRRSKPQESARAGAEHRIWPRKHGGDGASWRPSPGLKRSGT